MLIYLDHSHIVLLEEVAADSPSDFASFMSFWRAKAFTLAISRVHLIEMRRHADPAKRERRYQVLEQFTPFRSDIGPRSEYPLSILELEIIAALGRKALTMGKASDDKVSINVFSEIFPDAASLKAVREFEDPIFDQFLKLFHSGVEMSIEAQVRPEGTPYKPGKASDLPREPISKEQGDQILEQLERLLNDDAALSELYGGLDAKIVRHAINQVIGKITTFVRRSQEIGTAGAYAEFVGVDLTTLGKKRMDKTVQESLFRDEVRRLAATVLQNLGPGVASSLAEAVAMADCPGYWLARRLDLEIRAAEPEQDASNAYDIDHVTYYPYVDLFFADKRIVEYMKRILQRSPGVVTKTARKSPQATARSITALRTALVSNSGA